MKKIKKSQLQSALLLALASGCAFADESLPADDLYFNDLPVVLTASRLTQPLSEAPSAMTVIDKKMIKASGFRSVPDLMRLVPGMYVSFSDANNPIVSLHGATDEFSRRMQVLIDGRSVYLPPLGGVNWAELPLLVEDIERIEVVRGPASASYGANSFYGVINIITSDASADSVISVSGEQARDAYVKLSGIGESLGYRLSLGQKTDNGFDNRFYNDHNVTNIINFHTDYRVGLSDTIELDLGYSDGVYGAGLLGRKDSPFRDKTAKSQFQKAQWTHNWSPTDETRLMYANTMRHTYDPLLCTDTNNCDAAVSRTSNFAQQALYVQRNQLELQNTHQLNAFNRLVWGAGATDEYADYSLYFKNKIKLNTWQVFAHEEWRVTDKAIFNIGSMYEDNGMGSTNGSPRASLNYHFAPQHTVRLSASTATRSPSMAEAYVNATDTTLGSAYIQPASPLKPEKIYSREIGYVGEFSSIGITLDARIYIDQMDDMIFVDRFVGGASKNYADSVKNMLTAEYKGFEATTKYHWDEKKSFLAFNYAYQEAKANFAVYPTLYWDTGADPTGKFSTAGEYVRNEYLVKEDFPNRFGKIVPSHSFSLLVSEQLGDTWQISAGYYYRMEVRPTSISPDIAPEYQMRRLDLRLAKSVKLAQRRSAEFAITLQNVTNDNYTIYDVRGWKTNQKDNPTYYSASPSFPGRGWVTATLTF